MALGAIAFVGNLAFGIYLTVSKLVANHFLLSLVSLTVLVLWLALSFLMYFFWGLASFSDSNRILDKLMPSLVLIAYGILGLGFCFGFNSINMRK